MDKKDFNIKWKDTEWGEFPEDFSGNACRIVSAQYFRGGEKSFWDTASRVVNTLYANCGSHIPLASDRERFRQRLMDGLLRQKFSFNSPVWYNLGMNDSPQCSACFIQPVQDDMESIMRLARNEAMLFKHGSGTGTNLSSLRSSKEKLSMSDGFASGPVSFMRMYDAVAGAIKSGGRTRRAAKMQVLDADHPDIMEFIGSKAEEGRKAKALIASGMDPAEAYASVSLQNMNTSVRIPDVFMDSLKGNDRWALRGRTAECEDEYASASDIFDALARAAWECGDPGVQFSDAINRANMAGVPINASNPCSEFVFMDNSACNLASLNVLKYARNDYSEFANDVEALVYAMDIIVGISGYPTPEIEANSHTFRPLGLGLTNLGALLMYNHVQYGSDMAQSMFTNWAVDLTREAARASAKLAKIFGAYPGWDETRMATLRKQCGGTLPIGAERFGVRNAQLTLMAPTGTISFMMDAESTGIEPVFAETMVKTLASGEVITIEPDCVIEYKTFCMDEPKTAIGSNPVTPEEHLLMMAAMQPYLSGAISKTVNLPADATVEDIKAVYMKAWELGLKCVAVFRDGCKGYQPLVRKPKPGEAVEVESLETMKPIDPNLVYDATALQDGRRRMPDERKSRTHRFSVGGITGYLHVGEYEDGTPGELFVQISKAGSTVGGLMDAWATTFSLALQYGVPLSKLVKKFKGSRFEPSGFTGAEPITSATSIVDYVVKWMEFRYLQEIGDVVSGDARIQIRGNDGELHGETCPECGSLAVQTGTCKACPACGWSGGCG